MGGDGGSIPGRADVVRVRGYGFKRNLGGMGYDPNTLVHVGDGRLSEDERRQLGFTRCHISEEVLRPPIVVDRKGILYTKENVLRCMVEKTLPPDLKYIKKSKDLKQIVPSLKGSLGAFDVWDSEVSRLQCPITGNVATGKQDFFVNWVCGCFFSKKAVKELSDASASQLRCPVCGGKGLDLIEVIPKKKANSVVVDEQGGAAAEEGVRKKLRVS